MSLAPPLDSPTAVRAGEALDAAQCADYLRQHLPDLPRDVPLIIEQFPGGYSNLTYCLRLGAYELVLRRSPPGAHIKGGHDMGREFRLLAALHPIYGRVPRPLVYCAEADVLGTPFYLMERVRGVILRARLPQGVTLTPGLLRQTSTALVDTLVDLHRLDVNALGLGDFGHPTGYVSRQVTGWTKRYQAAQTDDLADMEQVAHWLSAHLPPENIATLIHNDFKYDNVILDPVSLASVMAVLDWEMATVGDPLMDLGTTLGYWAEADDPVELRQFNLTSLPGNLTRRQVVEHYGERSGRRLTHLTFYYVFGLFKIGVIVQQLYARYRRGQTQDERFASLLQLERALAGMAVKELDRPTL